MKLSEYQWSRSFFDLLVKGHSDFKVKCLNLGLYSQVSDSGPLGPLVMKAILVIIIIVVVQIMITS